MLRWGESLKCGLGQALESIVCAQKEGMGLEVGPAAVDFVDEHNWYHHRIAHLRWIAHGKEYTVIHFPVGVLWFHPPHTTVWSQM